MITGKEHLRLIKSKKIRLTLFFLLKRQSFGVRYTGS